MTTQRAIIVQEPGRATLAQDVPIPELPDNYILVKTKAGIFSLCFPSLPGSMSSWTKIVSSRFESNGLASY
jgi:hypothetical protein